MLTPEKKQVRLATSRDDLSLYNARSSEVSRQICHHGRDLGSQLRSRDQAAEQAVEACHSTYTFHNKYVAALPCETEMFQKSHKLKNAVLFL